MADAALLDLMHHLTWQPPALMGPAPAVMEGGASEKAYEAFLDKNEEEAKYWKEHGVELRNKLWGDITSGAEGLSFEAISGMIVSFERGLRREAQVLRRLKRDVERDLKEASPQDVGTVRRLNGKLLAIAEDFHSEGKDFALFLRALRAEIDPEARGGPTFDNPDALEAYLLSAVA